MAASRTDKGVHARRQTIHFDVADGVHSSPFFADPQRLEYKLNQLLPPDAVVFNVSLAPPTGTIGGLPWHANIAPTGKLYSYRWRCSEFMDPLERRDRAHWYKGDMDLDKLAEGLRLFEGSHDFASWANRAAHNLPPGQALKNTVRTIRRIELVEEDGAAGDMRLDFEVDGALYRMIRNVVGGLWGLATDNVSENEIHEIFRQRDRNLNPTRSAPACGLTLEDVYYDAY